MNKPTGIECATTAPIGYVYPTESIMACKGTTEGDYSGIGISLNENNQTVVVDFSIDSGTDDFCGGTVAFNRQSLRVFIAILNASLEALNSDTGSYAPTHQELNE